MSKMIFVNLPVADLAAATRFYEAIGCTRNAMFSDDKASSMVWSDTITFQLLTREYFATFTSKPIPDARASCQVLLCVSVETRDGVDALVVAGEAAGGNAGVREPQDMGFMYNRAIEDPDGHILEIAWMDMNAFAGEGEETAAA